MYVVVNMTPSRLVFEILTTTLFRHQGPTFSVTSGGHTAALVGGSDFQHGVSYQCHIVTTALECAVLSYSVRHWTDRHTDGEQTISQSINQSINQSFIHSFIHLFACKRLKTCTDTTEIQAGQQGTKHWWPLGLVLAR